MSSSSPYPVSAADEVCALLRGVRDELSRAPGVAVRDWDAPPACGLHVKIDPPGYILRVEDANDLTAGGKAMEEARGQTERPSLIIARTHIGFGSPHKQDSSEAHGSPLGGMRH